MPRLKIAAISLISITLVSLTALVTTSALMAQNISIDQFSRLNSSYTQNRRLSMAKKIALINKIKSAPGFDLCTYRRQSLTKRATFYSLGLTKIIDRYSYQATRIDAAIKALQAQNTKVQVLELLSSEIKPRLDKLKQIQSDVEVIFENLTLEVCKPSFNQTSLNPLVTKLDAGAKIAGELDVLITNDIANFLASKI